MAVLFVSHASKDDAHATALETWLRANGFSDLFVDHASIAGGEHWRDVRFRVFDAPTVSGSFEERILITASLMALMLKS